jgi:hypothetical protein
LRRREVRGLCVALAAALALAACNQPPPKPAPPPPPAKPKIGVVGHIAQVKERGMTADNWKGVIGSLFTYDTEGNVTGVRYEVTVLYDDSTSGVVVVPEVPNLKPGQRVRVTGNQIEPLAR